MRQLLDNHHDKNFHNHSNTNHYQMHLTINVFTIVIMTLCLLQPSNSFIIQGRKGYKKCFNSQVSPDKVLFAQFDTPQTLQAKFSFPRRQRQNCAVLFSVQIIEQDQKTPVYNDVHRCHQFNMGQPVVVKHTSEQYMMDGQYKICVNVLDDKNQELLMEIFIGERLNPIMYGDSDDNVPLIQAAELLDLDTKIQTIRKSLGWSRKLLEENTQIGDLTEMQVIQLESFAYNATLVQILFLCIYAGVWVYFIKNQKDAGQNGRGGTELY